MGKGGQTPANPSQCPSCHRPHLGLPACCPPTHFAASVASLLCSSLPRTSVAISGLSFRALPPACAVSSSVSFLVSRLLSALADWLTRFVARLGRSCPKQSPAPRPRVAVGPRRIGSLKRASALVPLARPDPTRLRKIRSCHRLARTSAWARSTQVSRVIRPRSAPDACPCRQTSIATTEPGPTLASSSDGRP